MDAAFEFLPAPSAGHRIVRVARYRRARLAADAQVSFIVLRQVAEAIRAHLASHSPPVPVREQAHFQQRFAARQAMLLRLLEILSRGDCSRRNPVNQISYGSRACISGSTLRN